MANVCSFPVRYSAGASEDARLVESARGLASLLTASREYQDFERLARAVNEDEQVIEMLAKIRIRHSSYGQSENGDLVARLEALAVMSAYRQAEQALRGLCAEVDAAVGAAAGIPFSSYVRPQGHG